MCSDKIIDDFLVYTSEYSNKEYFENYDDFQKQYSSLPAKLKNSESFSKWEYYLSFLESRKSGVCYRKKDDAEASLLTYWTYRVNQIVSCYTACNSSIKYSQIDEKFLRDLSFQSVNVENVSNLSSYLLSNGIFLIMLTGEVAPKIDGFVFETETGNPVVALTMRYNRMDYFWFTLFHELAHVVLGHVKKEKVICVDLEDADDCDDDEDDANTLALDSFIPRNKWRNCRLKYSPNRETVYQVAQELKIHPAILAGRYRYEYRKFDVFSDIINEYKVTDYLK